MKKASQSSGEPDLSTPNTEKYMKNSKKKKSQNLDYILKIRQSLQVNYDDNAFSSTFFLATIEYDEREGGKGNEI